MLTHYVAHVLVRTTLVTFIQISHLYLVAEGYTACEQLHRECQSDIIRGHTYHECILALIWLIKVNLLKTFSV